VLSGEAIAQAGGLSAPDGGFQPRRNADGLHPESKSPLRRPVVSGDQLRIEVVVKAWRHTAARLEGKLRGRQSSREAIVTCRLVPRALAAGKRAASDPE